MKFALFLALLILFTSSVHSEVLDPYGDWDKDIEEIVDLLRYTFKGFMSKFHNIEEYPLHDRCMGTEFVIDAQHIVKIIQSDDEDYIMQIIEIFERLAHMYDISEAHCDINVLISEIDTQCSKVGCDYFKLFLRGESHMKELIELYRDIERLIQIHFKDLEEAEEAFRLIGVDWAKGFHIMLAMN